MVVLRFIHGDVLFELLSLLFAFGLIFEEERFKAWGWASAGVMLFLAASGQECLTSGFVLLV